MAYPEGKYKYFENAVTFCKTLNKIYCVYKYYVENDGISIQWNVMWGHLLLYIWTRRNVDGFTFYSSGYEISTYNKDDIRVKHAYTVWKGPNFHLGARIYEMEI